VFKFKFLITFGAVYGKRALYANRNQFSFDTLSSPYKRRANLITGKNSVTGRYYDIQILDDLRIYDCILTRKKFWLCITWGRRVKVLPEF